MSDPDQPLFAGTSLAERIERVEIRLIVAATEAAGRRTVGHTFVIPAAGGVACFADAGSPINKVVGVGFGGMPGDAELTEIERAFAALDTPVQVEFSSLGDPQIAAALTGRDYRLVSFENVLGRALTEAPRPDMPDGVEVRCSDDLATWIDVVVEGFAHPDAEGAPSHEEFPRDIVENAERDTTQPGSKSQHNVQRRGFHLLYTRAVLNRETVFQQARSRQSSAGIQFRVINTSARGSWPRCSTPLVRRRSSRAGSP